MTFNREPVLILTQSREDAKKRIPAPQLRYFLYALASWRATFSVLLLLAASLTAAEPTLQQTNAPAQPATLTKIDATWNSTFRTSTGTRQVSFDKLVAWGHPQDARSGLYVILTDGSLLVGKSVSGKATELAVKCSNWGTSVDGEFLGTTKFTRGQVRGILFQVPAKPIERDRIAATVSRGSAENDELWLENGDRLQGRFLRIEQDPTNPKAQQVVFQAESGQAVIALSRVTAILWDRSLSPQPRRGKTMRLCTRDGSQLHVAKIDFGNLGEATLSLPGGIRLQSHIDVDFTRQIVALRPLGGTARYLSDLKPIGYKHIPYLSLTHPYGRDRNVLGGRLRTSEAIYAKGISMRSTSRLAYTVPAGYTRLEADLALDDAAGELGSVTYRVFVDTGAGFQPKYKSPIIRGGDKPRRLSLDIGGAKRIVLIVDFAERADVNDYANWLGARLLP